MISTRKHLIIPDCQITPDTDPSFLRWIGNYIVKKQPDVIVNLGDFADMYSLNSYEKGKGTFEGSARYHKDIEAANTAMDTLMGPYHEYVNRQKRNKKGQAWNPRWVLTLGNHEDRITRAISYDTVKLEGFMSLDQLNYREHGWEVYPFLEVVDIDGILYSHYFPRSPSGRVMQSKRGASSARIQAGREHQSCTAGHMQGFDYAELVCSNRIIHGLIAGSCYLDDFDFLTSQGTEYWRGIIVKHEVRDGMYDLMKVSLNYLRDNYDY